MQIRDSRDRGRRPRSHAAGHGIRLSRRQLPEMGQLQVQHRSCRFVLIVGGSARRPRQVIHRRGGPGEILLSEKSNCATTQVRLHAAGNDSMQELGSIKTSSAFTKTLLFAELLHKQQAQALSHNLHAKTGILPSAYLNTWKNNTHLDEIHQALGTRPKSRR